LLYFAYFCKPKLYGESFMLMMKLRLKTFLTMAILATVVAYAGDVIPRDSCRAIVKRFEMLSNTAPDKMVREASAVLSELKRGETANYYFIAYNIYVESLFNQGDIPAARSGIRRMFDEAKQLGDAECMTIMRRAEGQFYYKIGLFRRAAESFRQGMEVCPDYKALRSYFTYSSTATWLVQTCIRLGRTAEAEQWIEKTSQMMLWLDQIGRPDGSGHNQVRTLSLKAQLRLAEGKAKEARRLLQKCEPYMLPQLPKRAYADYYVARMQLDTAENKTADALVLLDTLINIHREDYRPIAIDFMKQKADLLMRQGQYAEAATTYSEYDSLKEQTDKVAIAQLLDEIRTEHEVDSLEKAKKLADREKMFVFVAFLFLLVALIILIMYYVKTSRTNKILVANIRERERVQALAEQQARQQQDEKERALMAEGQRIASYIVENEHYLQPDYGRSEIMKELNVGERRFAQAVAKATGTTVTDYVNSLRLNLSARLLEHSPELTISQIACRCGFGTLRQFQRQFKQRFGISPSTYRDSAGKQ